MKLISIVCLFLLSSCFMMLCGGCMPKKVELTREQWLDMTSHKFENTTVNEVLKAGEKVLRTADPSDVSVYHLPNKMVGNRKYLVYAVFAAAFGSFNFDLSAVQNGNNVDAQLLIGHSSQPIIPTMAYTPGTGGGLGVTAAPGMVNIGTPLDRREQYDLFYNRMESLIYNKTWVNCKEAEENKSSTALESMCMLADDNTPDGVKLSLRSADMLAEKIKYEQARKEANRF